jgi:hypothetical protein
MVQHFSSFLLTIALLLTEFFAVLVTGAPQNVYQFSGIIYLVYPNGQTVSTSGLTCPASAPNACSNLNSPNWCCPSGYVCAVPAGQPGIIGCCPSGQSCAGTPSVTTVTVAAAPEVIPNTVVIAATPTAVITPAPTTNVVVAPGGFCSTMTAHGPGLPTTAQSTCGTILIVNGAKPFRALGSVSFIAGCFWIGRFLLIANLF